MYFRPIRRTISEGIATPSKKDPSILLYKISSNLPYGLSNILPGAGFYQILQTDYTNFAVIYKCINYGLLHIGKWKKLFVVNIFLNCTVS